MKPRTLDPKAAAACLLMAAAFVVVVVKRDRIRAAWWADRLSEAESLEDQSYYVACLAGIGDDALAALQSLRDDPRSEVQALSIAASQGLSPQRRLHDILAPLLASNDPDVRHSAATAIVFMGTKSSLSNLVGHATRDCGKPVSRNQSADYAAAAATAGLARLSDPSVGPVLCAVLLTHPAAAVRAQAAESLGGYLKGESEGGADSEGLNQAAIEGQWGLPPCDPIEALTRAISDDAEFSGLLAVEREIEAVRGFMASRGGVSFTGATTQSAESDEPVEMRRTVGEIAARVLSELETQERKSSSLHPVPDGPQVGEDRAKE